MLIAISITFHRRLLLEIFALYSVYTIKRFINQQELNKELEADHANKITKTSFKTGVYTSLETVLQGCS